MNRFSWPFATVIGLGLTFLVAIFWLIPRDMPEARSAMLGVITTGIGGVVTAAVGLIGRQAEKTQQSVDQLVRQTNGNMATLIAAKTQPKDPAVSRETSAPEPGAPE